MTTIEIGNLGEATVLQEFLRRGILCYLPYESGSRVDLIADFNGKLNKIQIKTCEKAIDGAMTWRVGGNSRHKQYSNTEVDYFALCCIENSIICMVPFDNQKSAITIRENENCNKTYNMHFASEFSIDNLLAHRGGKDGVKHHNSPHQNIRAYGMVNLVNLIGLTGVWSTT